MSRRQTHFYQPRHVAKAGFKASSTTRSTAASLKTLWFGISLAALLGGGLVSSAIAQDADGPHVRDAQSPDMADTVSPQSDSFEKIPSASRDAITAAVPAGNEPPSVVADPSSEAALGTAASQSDKSSTDGDTTASITEESVGAPAHEDVPSQDTALKDQDTALKDTVAKTGPADAAASHMPDIAALPKKMQAVLERLVFAEAKPPHAAESQKLNEAIAAFYTMRDFAPLWTSGGVPTQAAKAVIDRLRHAPDDGLDLVILPDLQGSTDDDMVKADLSLTEAVIAYGRAASGGRIDPKTISPLIGEKPETPEPFDILASVSAAGDAAGNVLQAYNPPQKGYQALREKLAEMRREKAPVAKQTIPSGPELTVGMRDPRVTLIRARFGLDVQQATAPEDLVYDTRVAAAIAGFQKTAGLPASGVLTARTIAALSGGQPSRLEDEILANMERWRWMPRDMGETYIAVNIPDFTVAVVRDDQVVTRHRVVVGKPDTPTPVFSNKMQYLIVNPYWNVPQSIIRKEFMPKMGGDLSGLSEQGWQVSSKHGLLTVRQPPGEKNALGRIKFLFPNDYSVYLHDTPSRALFASTKRAFSHGCVRVDQPFSFAETVLNHSWSEQRLKGLIGSTERYINLPAPLPIHIEYFTTYVDETGRLQLRDDLYGYSRKVKIALGLER